MSRPPEGTISLRLLSDLALYGLSVVHWKEQCKQAIAWLLDAINLSQL